MHVVQNSNLFRLFYLKKTHNNAVETWISLGSRIAENWFAALQPVIYFLCYPPFSGIDHPVFPGTSLCPVKLGLHSKKSLL